MAPEQATAYDRVDARCDIYSLGAVAYYLLTGRPPFTGKSPAEILMAHAHRDVVPPGKVEPSVPADLEQIVIRSLDKDPAKRFQDVTSLDRALAACKCAGKWTDRTAESWWMDNEPEAAHAPHSKSVGPDRTESRSAAEGAVERGKPEPADKEP
jgi:serine/threonine-protein kinase